MLPACSGTASVPVGQVLRGEVRAVRSLSQENVGPAHKADGEYVDVSEYSASAIGQYRADNRSNGGPTCEVGPVTRALGMASGPNGTLYVAAGSEKSGGGGVMAFSSKPTVSKNGRCGPAVRYFPDPYVGNGQLDPAIDGSMLYLANSTDGISLPASVVVYNVKEGTNPVGNLIDPTVGNGYAVAVDSHHNLFWSSWNKWTGGGQVIEFPRGRMPGTVLKPTMIGTDSPGSVLVDRNNNLLLLDQSKSEMLIYETPYNKRPFAKISLKGREVFCALGTRDERLFCLDYESGAVDVYSYPAGTYLYSYSNGIDMSEDPIGIAVRPATK